MIRRWAVAQGARLKRRGTSAAARSRRDWETRDMRQGYFTVPVHHMQRNWTETLKENREDISLADQLGIHAALKGAHLTVACETTTNIMMLHASLIPATKQIKPATGTSN